MLYAIIKTHFSDAGVARAFADEAAELFSNESVQDEYSATQLDFFRRLVSQIREGIQEQLQGLASDESNAETVFADPTDRSSSETSLREMGLLKAALRHRLSGMDRALIRLRDNDYGYCSDTGELIPYRRLLAQPDCLYSVEGQTKIEHAARVRHAAPAHVSQFA